MLSLKQLKKIKNGLKKEHTSQAPSNTQIDPCAPSPTGPTAVCNMLATAEGGNYTSKNPNTSASGRYQFVHKTAIDLLTRMGTSNPEEVWSECGRSASSKCKNIQDAMCRKYSEGISASLIRNGHEATTVNTYLAWQQGRSGANIILNSRKTGEPITNPHVLKNMRSQGSGIPFSPYGAVFYDNLVKYMRRKGIAV